MFEDVINLQILDDEHKIAHSTDDVCNVGCFLGRNESRHLDGRIPVRRHDRRITRRHNQGSSKEFH